LKMRMRSPAEGARTSLYCATAPELGSDTGLYYDDCRRREPSRHATPERAAELWERSDVWVA
jgi:retinol dehydrogenase 12